MRRSLFFLMCLFTVFSLILGGCGSKPAATTTTTTTHPSSSTTAITSTTPTSTPSTTVKTTTVPPVTTTTTPASSTSPTPTPSTTLTTTLTPTTTQVRISTKITDSANDTFDMNGAAATMEAFMDIVSAELYMTGDDYTAVITVVGDIPLSGADPQMWYEWDVYVDADRNVNTGSMIILNNIGIGAEYFARFCVLGPYNGAEIRDLVSDKNQFIHFTVKGNVITFTWPASFCPSDLIYFGVNTGKYGDQGESTSYKGGDIAPDKHLTQYPPSN